MHNTSTKVWLFIICSSLSLLVLGYQLGERLGLLISFLFALLLNYVVFFHGESTLIKKLYAKKISGQDPWGVLHQVKSFAQQFGVPTPHVYIIESEAVNSFAVGHSWRKGSIGFTTKLLQTLESEDLKSVIAYQFCNLQHLDTFSCSVSSTLANSLVGFGEALDSLLPSKLRFFTPLFAPIGLLLIKLFVDKKSFFENDLRASQLLEDRRCLGEVLWRLDGIAQTRNLKAPLCTSHLFIVSPEGFRNGKSILTSHPNMKERLKKLLGYYPV